MLYMYVVEELCDPHIRHVLDLDSPGVAFGVVRLDREGVLILHTRRDVPFVHDDLHLISTTGVRFQPPSIALGVIGHAMFGGDYRKLVLVYDHAWK